jgi:hypothetical protein
MPSRGDAVMETRGWQAAAGFQSRLAEFAIISESGGMTVSVNPTMSTHPVVSSETYREKALRKFKQQPLVPVGALSLTVHVEAY